MLIADKSPTNLKSHLSCKHEKKFATINENTVKSKATKRANEAG
jgi:hypothetical protein